MFGIGTLINTLAIIIGGLFGSIVSKVLNEGQRESLIKACGISVLFIAIAGAMEGMLKIEEGSVMSGQSMLVVLCLAIGTLIGELIGIENYFIRFGEWLKRESGNSKDQAFVGGFVNASLTVCIGAMAIVGAIQDGILSDYSTLAVKSVLDFIIIAIMTTGLGKGCIFSAIPVFFFEGGITLLAKLISPLLNALSLSYLSLIGSILIFCVGINLLEQRKIRVANMLPAVIIAVIVAYLPF
ncbi:MAG: DUF554 domain-containing protein [Solobacterium sp.]|nr:DUF554 domain-containing protein [Solobacterium sp.]